MSIINLKKRITNDVDEYENNKKSERSYIYVNEDIKHDNCSPEVLILTVGDSYYAKSQKLKIPEKGLVIKPGRSKVIETKQNIATPLNVIGVIYGLGTNIYQNGFVSTGKIDQGYSGNLKIGFYNGGKKNFIFKRDEVLASVIFFSTEETLSAAFSEQQYENSPSYELKLIDRIQLFFSDNWVALLSFAVSVISLIIDWIK